VGTDLKTERRPFYRKINTFFLRAVVFCALFYALLGLQSRPAQAICGGCVQPDCGAAIVLLGRNHFKGNTQMMTWISNEFTQHRQWLSETFFRQNVLPALMLMTEQLSAVAMQQALVIGTFLDAKHQLETQRIFQTLQAEAHKDYHPSEDFCWFGTGVRSLAHSESMSRHKTKSLDKISLDRHLGNANLAGARNRDGDYEARWRQFASTYCDPKDNNWQGGASGLQLACLNPGDPVRRNRDIDYTRLIDEPRTLNEVLFVDDVLPPVEEDVIAMAKNLYGHKVLSRKATKEELANDRAQHLYLALRSVAAKRSVAENSYNAIVGLKSSGTSDVYDNMIPETRLYLAAVLKELGMSGEEALEIMGNWPSYYAQLEVLSKKIYQNPDFYANLYDKPANVARKRVALQAIELMLDRAIYESQLRQEMAMSVLLSSKLRPAFRDVNKELSAVNN